MFRAHYTSKLIYRSPLYAISILHLFQDRIYLENRSTGRLRQVVTYIINSFQERVGIKNNCICSPIVKAWLGYGDLKLDCTRIVYKKTQRTSGLTKCTVVHPSQQPARPHFLINPPYHLHFADRKHKTTESCLFYLIPVLALVRLVLYYKKNDRYHR